MAAAASVAAAAAASVTSSRHGSQDADDEDNPGLGDRQSGDDPDADAEQMIVDRLPYQARVRQLYASQPTTTAIALLIFINFVISAVDKQINPLPGSTSEVAINGFELFFALVFGVELVLNLYAHWFAYFFKSGWNIFDLVIVTVTFIGMGSSNIPGVNVLRLFRAFRVFRLFKRVESLRIIVEGVGAALPGVGNAFVLLGLLMGIWSIIGVEFFREYADEEFGNFLKAMFTMWQVMTLDGWASNVARPLLYDNGLVVAAPFFISFTFVAGIVMTNVVIAILLEKYLTATADAQEQRLKAKAARNAQRHIRKSQLSQAADDEDYTASVSTTSTARRDRKLEKEDLISMLLETLDSKHLNSLETNELVNLASLLWHHPALHEYIPDEIKKYEPPRQALGGAAGGSAESLAANGNMAGNGNLARKGQPPSVSILLNLLHRTQVPLATEFGAQPILTNAQAGRGLAPKTSNNRLLRLTARAISEIRITTDTKSSEPASLLVVASPSGLRVPGLRVADDKQHALGALSPGSQSPAPEAEIENTALVLPSEQTARPPETGRGDL